MSATITLKSQAMAFCHIKLVGEVMDDNPNKKEKYAYEDKIINADV